MGGKIYVFDEDDINLLQEVTISEEHGPIPAELFQPVKKAALDLDREEEGDIFNVGYYGTASLDPPLNAEEATSSFAVRWLCEIVTVTHGVEYERSRMQAGK